MALTQLFRLVQAMATSQFPVHSQGRRPKHKSSLLICSYHLSVLAGTSSLSLGFSSHIYSHICHFPVNALNHFKLFSSFSTPHMLKPSQLSIRAFLYLPPSCSVPLGFHNSLHSHPLILSCYAEMPATHRPQTVPRLFATVASHMNNVMCECITVDMCVC